MPFVAWNLNPENAAPDTITCDLAAPCNLSGPLQIAYTITDHFGNPPSSGIITMEPWNAVVRPGNIQYAANNTTIVIPGAAIDPKTNQPFTVPLNQPLTGTVVNADPAAGTGTVLLSISNTGTAINVALPSNNTLQFGEPVLVRVQPAVLTVGGGIGSFCVDHPILDANGNVIGNNRACSDENGCTINGQEAAGLICQHSSFADVTIIRPNEDPDNPPLEMNVLTTVATDVCGVISNTNNAACPNIFFLTMLRANGGSGAPPVGVVDQSYGGNPLCTDAPPCTEFRFLAESSRTGGEPITFSWSSVASPQNPVPGLTLSQDGLLSGTPNTPGLFTFKVTATGEITEATEGVTFTVLIQPAP